jgi:hypothetical protein
MKCCLLFSALTLSILGQHEIDAATCGGGNVGDGVCPTDGLCCSEFGWCDNAATHCANYCGGSTVGNGQCQWINECCSTTTGECSSSNCGHTTPPPTPSGGAPQPSSNGDSRLIAYVGNWLTCPSVDQYDAYTHVVISFAVTYQWQASGQHLCDPTCTIAGVPPVCAGSGSNTFVADLQAAGKKVLLSFGGAGMGGSWDGLNTCWEDCYGKETSVVNQLVGIVNNMGLDGVDIDYEYYYEDGQNGSGFSLGAEAQHFLTDVTVGLRSSLLTGSIVTHAPIDADVVPGTGYYNVLVNVASSLDFIMVSLDDVVLPYVIQVPVQYPVSLLAFTDFGHDLYSLNTTMGLCARHQTGSTELGLVRCRPWITIQLLQITCLVATPQKLYLDSVLQIACEYLLLPAVAFL